jgi:hypothetical protein
MDQENLEPKSAEPPSISLQDLVVLLNLIRLSADRGAVRAEEMATIGSVYEKLFNFLQSSGAIQSQLPPKETSD